MKDIYLFTPRWSQIAIRGNSVKILPTFKKRQI
jgi:hypothetical protein